MSKFLVVFLQEYATVVKKKSFLVGIFLTPLMMGAFTILPTLFASAKSTTSEQIAIIDQSQYEIGPKFASALEEFYLEDSNEPYYSMEAVFSIAPNDSLRFREVIDSLRTCIVEKDLKYFLVIRPGAHTSDSNLFLVTNSDNFRSIRRFENSLSNILSSIRLEMSDVNLEVDSVLALTERTDLRLQDAKGESIPFQIKYFAAIAFAGIMFGMIFGFGQLVMRSIIEEKNSRIIEVLVSSVSPFQLMMGKVFGLGAANLTQVAIWVLLGAGLYSMKSSFDIDPSIDRILFNPAIVTFFVLFMVSGYLLYSTLFALIGSIVNTEKEAQAFIMPITMIMILPFMLGIHVVQEPSSTLSTVLSFIPLLTPTMMMMRVVFIAPTLTDYSIFSGIIGEATLGFVIVVVTMLGMIWLTAKVFRVGILMYGKRPTLPEIWKWIKY